MSDVLTAINSIFSDSRRGLLPTSDASRLAHVVDIARRAIESGDVEKRLAALEARLLGKQEPDA
jgi:hypothetical protein